MGPIARRLSHLFQMVFLAATLTKYFGYYRQRFMPFTIEQRFFAETASG
jgi:hypothetical protein